MDKYIKAAGDSIQAETGALQKPCRFCHLEAKIRAEEGLWRGRIPLITASCSTSLPHHRMKERVKITLQNETWQLHEPAILLQ